MCVLVNKNRNRNNSLSSFFLLKIQHEKASWHHRLAESCASNIQHENASWHHRLAESCASDIKPIILRVTDLCLRQITRVELSCIIIYFSPSDVSY